MVRSKGNGSRTRVAKPGVYVFDKIKEQHTRLPQTTRVRKWINNIPECDDIIFPEKELLTQVHDKRDSRPGRGSMPLQEQPTITVRDKVRSKRSETCGGDRRATRVSQKQNQVPQASSAEQTTNFVPEPQHDQNDAAASQPQTPLLAPTERSSSPSKNFSQTSRTSSLSKKSTRIDAKRLALYDPTISFTTYADAKKDGILTDAVRTLWQKYLRPCMTNPHSIPLGLKDKVDSFLDTPEKSKNPPPPTAYGDRDCFSEEDLMKIWPVVEDILEQAAIWRSSGVPEAHWCDQVVTPLLNLVRRLECCTNGGSGSRPRVIVLNISSLEIRPPELCPSPPDLEAFKALNKKIDYAMGLRLSRDDVRILSKAVYAAQSSVPSINQTETFTNFIPMFLHVEVKKHVSDVDPLVQLAVWVTADFRKRAIEGYHRNIPVLAATVVGDVWNFWVAYEPASEKPVVEEVVFLGPWSMDTTDFQSIFATLRFLVSIATWARTEYYDWFSHSVLDLYR